MNNEEARAVLREHLKTYRQRAYADLLCLQDEQDCMEVTAPSGVSYQLEFLAVYDDRERSNLRVMGSIDDGGIRAFVPLTESFIMAPDGTFVGE